jgi:deoxyribonuclease V
MFASDWDGTIDGARALLPDLARRVVLRDGFAKPLRVVAGFATGFEDDGKVARATAVLLDADNFDVLDARMVRVPTTLPYVPGLLTFRQMPALLEALDTLSQPPDLAMVAGAGIAHGRRFGLASHFGVATGLPTIGVATKAQVGTAAGLHQIRGAYTPLREHGEQIGWMLRSKPRCQPLVVSPGHRVAMASAADLVMRFTKTYRLPEPVRLAERLAARRSGEPDAASHE